MNEPPQVGSDETVTDRGFTHWDPIDPVAGRGDGSDQVRFYESSGATAIRGTTDDPVFIDGPFAWLSVGGTTAHLTYDEVQQLNGYMGRWLALHREARGLEG